VVFDYRMRAGVVTKSNALALMRSVGIEVWEGVVAGLTGIGRRASGFRAARPLAASVA